MRISSHQAYLYVLHAADELDQVWHCLDGFRGSAVGPGQMNLYSLLRCGRHLQHHFQYTVRR